MIAAKKRRQQESFSNGSSAVPVYCKSCGAVELPAPKWEAYGGRGLCEACDPDVQGAGYASREAMSILNHRGVEALHEMRAAAAKRKERSTLSTTTPAGIAANDPEALPRSREAAKEDNAAAPINGERQTEHGPRGPFRFTTSIASLGRNRFNPREHFDEAELAQLAESLRKYGQIQPVIVRKTEPDTPVKPLIQTEPGHTKATHEIVAGERRVLAAMRLGWTRITVEEITCDDARACELAIAENRDRKDISQVEYARGLQKLADLKKLDPAGLAADQGISEPHVRNLLRLLKTPPEWQQLVIEGKIDGTHLRTAAPYLHVPAIAEGLAKELDAKEKPSLSEWSDSVRQIAWDETHPLEGSTYGGPENGYRRIKFAIPESEYGALGVIEIENYFGTPEKRAANVKLAKELLARAEAEARKKAAKKSDKKDARAAKEKAELSPAERKKREAEQREKFERRLENWFYDWLRALCAAAIQPPYNEQGAQWLIAFALWARPSNDDRERELAAELAGYKPKQSEYGNRAILAFLEPRDGDAAAALMHCYAPRLLVDADGAPRGPTNGQNPTISDDVVAALAREVLSLDVAAAWRDDRKSPLREKFWNLHSKDELAALGEELGVYIDGGLKKSQAVDVLLAVERPLALPKELAKLAAPFETPKKKPGVKAAKVRKPR